MTRVSGDTPARARTKNRAAQGRFHQCTSFPERHGVTIERLNRKDAEAPRQPACPWDRVQALKDVLRAFRRGAAEEERAQVDVDGKARCSGRTRYLGASAVNLAMPETSAGARGGIKPPRARMRCSEDDTLSDQNATSAMIAQVPRARRGHYLVGRRFVLTYILSRLHIFGRCASTKRETCHEAL